MVMDTNIDAVFSSWEFNPWVLIPILITGLVYARGWRQLHRRAPHRFGFAQLIAFNAGLITIVCALESPLDAFAGWLLTVHMIQHLLLMMVAPPLVLYGAPYLPLLFGLPPDFLRNGIGPFLASSTVRRVNRFVAHPIFCWSAFILTSTVWHVPRMYELALSSSGWHELEHLCFLTTALLFWSPVIQPYPWAARVSRWVIIPYLFFADFQNSALSAFLVFYERVLYPTYQTVPRITGMTALDDQAAAGAIMWVAGSIFYLIPVGLITVEVLSTRRAKAPSIRDPDSQPTSHQREKRQPASRGSKEHIRVDLLSLPLIGSILGWPYFRRAAQGLMFVMAMVIIVDGLWGPQMAAMNLAGVLPWTHWRGLSVLALLAVGNMFCMACPFNFARELGRRLLTAGWSWPRRLRSKWIAISLLLVFFWAYEAFGLWDSPRWTAWMVLSYFAAAVVVDGLFKGASFCKYVCPIGQYQFIQSLISPVEVTVRNLEVCSDCKTHDCLRGNEKHRGCELQLFQPRKSSNMDCTFCLDCIHACPHENVSLLASRPGIQLVRIERRKRPLRWFMRFDFAILIFLLVFAAFVNAGSMVQSVQAWERRMQIWFALGSVQPIIAVLYLVTLVIVPALLVGLCIWLARMFSHLDAGWRETISSFAIGFVPLGFSMWLVHFSYHLLTGLLTAVPVIQRAAIDVGVTNFGVPDWALSSRMLLFDWIPSLQLILLDFGLLCTLYVGWRLARRFRLRFARTLGLLAPWGALAFVLYSIGIWIIFQPMQMRGMMMDGMH